MEKIYDFQLVTELTNKNSGFGRWGFAVKDGKEYFIKEFLSPVHPESSLPISEKERSLRMAECQAFYQRKYKLYEAIKKANNGNIVQVEAFFRHKTHYYIVTEKVNTSSLSIEEISRLDDDKKLLLLKVLAHCIKNLSHEGIIHGDLKPNNILVKKTMGGFYTLKLIDFDSSFFENTVIKNADDIQGDTVYMAPETFLCIIEECHRISVKADVFALGILFHQYLSGCLPRFPSDYDYMYEAVLADAPYQLSPRIPERYQKLIRRMLEKEPEKRMGIDEVLDALTGSTRKDVEHIPNAAVDDSRTADHGKDDSSWDEDEAPIDYIDENGWITDIFKSWSSDVHVSEQPDADVRGLREPGIVESTSKRNAPVVVKGVKISGNMHKG